MNSPLIVLAIDQQDLGISKLVLKETRSGHRRSVMPHAEKNDPLSQIDNETGVDFGSI